VGRMVLARQQAPLVMADEHYGDPCSGSCS
jgi:hypothetical protein